MSSTDIRYHQVVGRWEPNARGRLQQAAVELYVERGFEQTTVAEIAERAGLTERTFFRHFADKREVLFSGAAELQVLLVNAVLEASAETSPMDAVAGAVEAAGGVLQQRRDFALERQAIISANPELRERELIKMASLASAMANALRQRGVKDQTAALAAEAGVAVFKIGFERWIKGSDRSDLPRMMRESMEELRAVTEGR
jgi:AcrR family transcriptional regulator